MSVPPLDDDGRLPRIRRHWFQFRLRHLFLLTTAVAIICGLAVLLGWEGMFYVSLAGSPIVSLIILIRTEGSRPDWAARVGAILPAVTFSGSHVVEMVRANAGSGFGGGAGTSTPFLIANGILAAVVGAVTGVVVSLPVIGLYYVARWIRHNFVDEDAPASRRHSGPLGQPSLAPRDLVQTVERMRGQSEGDDGGSGDGG